MPKRSPVILNQIGPELGERLAGHWSRPRVIAWAPHGAPDGAPDGVPPWAVPEGVDVLLTRPIGLGWEAAPDTPPPGWPFGLSWIQTASTGIDFYPRWLLDGPPVTCGRGVSAVPIAEFTLGAILAFEKRFEDIRMRSAADWRRAELGSLAGKRLGLVGFGAIGRAIAARALAFGLRVGAVRRSGWARPEPGVEPFASAAELAAVSDHLVLALPLTAQSRRIVDADLLARAKPGLHLVNIARGALVDQEALLAAVEDGRVAGATLDVTDPEPLPDGHPFYRHPRIRLTPHVSWADASVGARLADKIAANLDAFAEGRPLSDVVDAAAGY